MDTETLPAAEAKQFATESQKLIEKQLKARCELVQCLDKKTLGLMKCLKTIGTAAGRELRNYLKSRDSRAKKDDTFINF